MSLVDTWMKDSVDRPTVKDCVGGESSYVTTPRTANMMQLLGTGVVCHSVALSRDEYKAVNSLYGFKKEPDGPRGVRELMQAGADRNALRHAECDGLRMLAWFAKFVPAGEDPLKHLVRIVAEAKLDVDPADVEWSEEGT